MALDKTPPPAPEAPLVAAAETPPLALAPTPPSRRYVELGYLFAATGALLFSTKAIAIKLVYEEAVDAETLLALRMAMALPFYAAIAGLAVRDRKRRGDPLPAGSLVLKSALVGALGYLFSCHTHFLRP